MMAEESETAARLSEEQKGSEREGELAVDEELEEGEIPDEESPEDASEATKGGAVQPHPLEHSWTFWFDNPSAKSKQSAWGSSIRPIHTFNTVEDFWSLYNNIHHPSKLVVGADFHCFKHKIEPKWEDPLCANGGKWTIACARGKSDTMWLYTLLAMIGEQFDYGDEICGVVVNVRGKQERIAMWTKSASNEDAQMSIGRQWKELLDYKDQIGFISHMKYYIIFVGKRPGIYTTWDECHQNVNGYSGALYRAVKSSKEAITLFKAYNCPIQSSNQGSPATLVPPPTSNINKRVVMFVIITLILEMLFHRYLLV